jgi:AraC-like DNA-binding protein
MSSVVRATNLWGYAELVRELGGDVAPLLARFRIPPGIQDDADAFVSFEAVARLLEASAEEFECPDFGLRLSRWQGLDMLGPVGVIARNADTVQDGLAAVARYLYVHSPALTFAAAASAGADLTFTFEITEMTLPQVRQSYELSMANGVRVIRLLAGADVRLSAVSFMHEQMGSDGAYAEALGCPVRFGQSWCGLEIPVTVARRRIDRADPETRRIATKYLDAAYVPGEAPFSERVAELARRLLPTGHCSADSIADQLALHPRTLQRRLAAEGVRCQELIERERRDQAARYLAEPRLYLSQIAGLLGYTEQSSLNRSVQRWFGKTPRQYRADLTR